jgi:signal transduction histidine kinase
VPSGLISDVVQAHQSDRDSISNQLNVASYINSTSHDYFYLSYDMVIKDSGPGIPEDKLNNLFINFSCLKDEQGLNKEGVGLGLSICKSIIEQMGGSVSVQSTVGEGSQFTVKMRTITKLNKNISHRSSLVSSPN